MVTTKLGKRTIPKEYSADNSNWEAVLPSITSIIKPTMKFDSAFQPIVDTVLELRQKHCIHLCFDDDDICTLQEMLGLERDDILELYYKD